MRRSPVRRHPLAAIEAAILLGGPCLLLAPRLEVGVGSLWQVDAPGRLERVAGLIERAGGAAALLTGIGPRIEPTQPFPLRLGTRIAGGAGDGADMDVAILD